VLSIEGGLTCGQVSVWAGRSGESRRRAVSSAQWSQVKWTLRAACEALDVEAVLKRRVWQRPLATAAGRLQRRRRSRRRRTFTPSKKTYKKPSCHYWL